MKTGKTSQVDFVAKGEGAVLSRIQRATGSGKGLSGLRLGIGDDAALWRTSPRHDTILTCDWFLEGIHFLRDRHAADSVGWKCLARALSDVAAMGGCPRCFLLNLALPASHLGKWLKEFLGGLRRASRRFACALVGGDTTRHQNILISVTVIGEVRSGHALLRSGARSGDILFVTGQIGEAEAGLSVVRESRGRINLRDPRLQKHFYPEPRVALGQWLASKRLASALMDLSDGLSTDLTRLCRASGVGARVYADRLPTPELTGRASRRDQLALALHGGDDYELLFAVPRNKRRLLPDFFHGLRLTAVGEITAGRSILIEDEDGTRPLRPAGWDPFRTGNKKR